MIILPAEQELDWRRPPIATILLILINCLVYFGYQLNDDERYQEAASFYVDSGLLQREAPVFLEYVEEHYGTTERQAIIQYAEANSLRSLVDYMLTDLRFTAYIKEKAQSTNAMLWDSKRENFSVLQKRISYLAFGFVPAEPTIQGFFGNMFLHGDIDHLLGNMLFLFVCGFALEIAFGRGWYLGLYLLSGCLSSGLSYVTGMQSFIPELGASGAVSGLMGMYVALYGMKQIQFFYWVIIFFGYFRAPALLIFPVWVGNELYGYFYSDTNINYMAHLGGLLAGFAGVALTKHRYISVDEAYVDKEIAPEEITSLKIEEMWGLAGRLRIDQAWKMGVGLLKTEPHNQQLLQQLYNIAKANPADDRIHKLLQKIMSTNAQNVEFEHFRLMLLEGYLTINSPPKALNGSNAVKMMTLACKYQYVDLSYAMAKILMSLLDSGSAAVEGQNKALLRVFMMQLKSKKASRTDEIMIFFERHAADSEELTMAKESVLLTSSI